MLQITLLLNSDHLTSCECVRGFYLIQIMERAAQMKYRYNVRYSGIFVRYGGREGKENENALPRLLFSQIAFH